VIRKTIYLLLLLLALLTPSSSMPLQEELDAADSPKKARIIAFPENAQAGTVLTVALSGIQAPSSDDFRALLQDEAGNTLSSALFFPLSGVSAPDGPVWVALLPVPAAAPSGLAAIVAEGGYEAGQELSLAAISVGISSRDYIREEIALDAGNTSLRTTRQTERNRESKELWGILSSFSPLSQWAQGLFFRPVDSDRRTSFFGDKRIYLYSNGSRASSVHMGVDFGIATGTQVRASAAGRVVLAKDRIITGKSVVIEHLPGVFTCYWHLDSLSVQLDEFVQAEQELGRSGSTGLSTGPHLHWELRVAGEYICPDYPTQRALLDKELILSKMTEKYYR
jgi:murein DD-endopeptidase MepM/ murein hydrolase activator NlpD